MSKKERNAFLSTLFCLVFLIIGKMLIALSQSIYPLFFVLAIISGGWKQTYEGLSELIHERTLNVDLLMALAAIGACLIGNWFEGAMLTFIFCLSGALEEYATNKSTKEITALMNVAPNEAIKIVDEKHITVPVEELAIGDFVFVPKGQAIPIDGRMLSSSSIEESAISGESVPVEKSVNDDSIDSLCAWLEFYRKLLSRNGAVSGCFTLCFGSLCYSGDTCSDLQWCKKRHPIQVWKNP